MAENEQVTSSEGTETGGADSSSIDFDVPQEDVEEMRQDPLAYIKKLGIEVEEGTTVEIATVIERYSPTEGWQENTDQRPKTYWPGMHCHKTGGTIRCYLN